MNIVLDTNSLIMSIAPRSPYRKVWNAFLSGDYNLCVSNEIIEEYSEVLSRNISPQVSEAIVYAILTRPNVIRKDPHYTFALIEADKDDNKFVLLQMQSVLLQKTSTLRSWKIFLFLKWRL